MRRAFILIPLVLICFALSPRLRAVTPAPDGGYPGFNTAEGTGALQSLTSGTSNTAVGFDALFHDTTGSDNTALGFQVLLFNTTGFQNAATGWRALFANTSGFHNTAAGFQALTSNTTGNHNTADGDIALLHNTTGNFNTASGAHALALNTSGDSNIALGFQAGGQLTTGSNNIDIGNVGIAAESRTIRIGTPGSQTRTFIGGIRGVTTGHPNAVPVVIDSFGQLGTVSSSERFKKEIEPMGQSSEAILALKPVRFHYKSDASSTPQFGLIAEEVAQVNPDLVVRDGKGEIYTVRYDAVNAMLLNEFLKEHKRIEEQQATIADLKSTVAQQRKDFGAAIAQAKKESELTAAQQQMEIQALAAILVDQAAQLQKVNAQLEANKTAPRIVLNNQ